MWILYVCVCVLVHIMCVFLGGVGVQEKLVVELFMLAINAR